jgi:hypothetical protein
MSQLASSLGLCLVTSYILYKLGPLPPHSSKILINVINTLLVLSQEKRQAEEEGHYRKSSFSNIAARHSFPQLFYIFLLNTTSLSLLNKF